MWTFYLGSGKLSSISDNQDHLMGSLDHPAGFQSLGPPLSDTDSSESQIGESLRKFFEKVGFLDTERANSHKCSRNNYDRL